MDHASPIIDTPGPAGAVAIVNADDWGRDGHTTDRILECARSGAISSASAMVFMQDSERAAQLAAHHGIDAGLHLNLSTPFSGNHVPARLAEEQARISRFLRSWPLARILYHPGLARSFAYVVKAQMEEFERLYGIPIRRVDGHHHLHLSANVLRQNLLPAGAIVRRNFSFGPGESTVLNRLYRRRQDERLSRRYRLAGYFFALPPLEEPRLQRMFALTAHADVEIMTHPVNEAEFHFLTGGALERLAGTAGVAHSYSLRFSDAAPDGTLTAAQEQIGSAR